MKIEVAKLNQDALEFKEEIPAKNWEIDSFDVKFRNNIEIEAKFLKIKDEILVEADCLVHKEITCSRCLNKAPKTDQISFKRSYNLKSLGQYLDIDQDLREEILLNFPMKVLCREDCKGVLAGG